jgi:hypothetical protein
MVSVKGCVRCALNPPLCFSCSFSFNVPRPLSLGKWRFGQSVAQAEAVAKGWYGQSFAQAEVVACHSDISLAEKPGGCCAVAHL